MLDAIVEVDGWTEVAPGVSLHTLPAGHTPGATGYLVRFRDGEESHDILLTGDFTLEDCAGYPGFDPDLAANVEVLFLTGATAEPHGGVLTEALGDALERAIDGGRTLVTAGALTGVHVTALLATANDELNVDIPVRLVGQGAKLYAALGYDHDTVELIPEFEDPRTCLTPGTITVAGPEVPRNDSSYRIFGELKDDADAAVVQLIAGGHTPVTTGGCQTTAYELSMHPAESDLQTVVEVLDPVHTVVTHRRNTPRDWNDWPSYVWSPGDTSQYDLYDAGSWPSPPWMESYRPTNADGTNRLGSISGDVFASLSLPKIARTQPVLANEGIDVDALRERIAGAVARREESTDETSDITPTDEPMSDSERLSRHTDGQLYRTATVNLQTEIPDEFEERLPAPDNFVSMRARQQLFSQDNADQSKETETDAADADGEAASTSPRRGPDETTEVNESEVAETRAGDETSASASNPESTTGPNPANVDTDADAELEETMTPPARADADPGKVTTSVDMADTEFELDPLVGFLLSRHVAELNDGRSQGDVVADAVEVYLGALVRDEEPSAADTPNLSVELSGRFGPVLADMVEEDDLDQVVRAGLVAMFGDEADVTTVAVPLGRCASLLDAAIDAHETFNVRSDVVETAVLWSLTENQQED